MAQLQKDFSAKFEFITIPIKQLSSLFSSPRSFFDLKIKFMNADVYVLPRIFESGVAFIKPILTGSVVVMTFISIYRRLTPGK